jgi:diphosphate-dependent phosphofructokinase|tara:strand:+ start:809 stop:1384 length:576 start_codon:yes stop_codon:yes gene_type:complete
MTRHRIRSIADQSHPVARSLHHGVVLLPEGLLSFCPETSALMRELEDLMSEVGSPPRPPEHSTESEAIVWAERRRAAPDQLENSDVRARLSRASREAAAQIPDAILSQLLLARDSHGNPSLSAIETDALVAELVRAKLAARHPAALARFESRTHFCGYEGRSGLPTDFDATYAYALGCVLHTGPHTTASAW